LFALYSGWLSIRWLSHHFLFWVLSLPQAFFDKEYIGSHAEDTEKITALKDLMQEQVSETPRTRDWSCLWAGMAALPTALSNVVSLCEQ
jgi:hypothetical protein